MFTRLFSECTDSRTDIPEHRYQYIKYMSIILIPYCTCMPSVNLGIFVISEQSHEENGVDWLPPVSQPHKLVHLMHQEPQLPLRNNGKLITHWSLYGCEYCIYYICKQHVSFVFISGDVALCRFTQKCRQKNQKH